MNISELMQGKMISVDLDASTRDDCIEKLIQNMMAEGYVTDMAAYREAVYEREGKGTTGVGFGFAIPHGKSSGIKKAGLAFAHLKTPIEWNSFDGKPVSIVFLIGVPDKDTGNEHLKILIALSKQIMHEDFQNKIFNAKTNEEVLEILEAI